ncbi:hypothetical protein L2E82_39318 [Cichorium intybus]|uniref:Uncharacterized protein n=1 Tax=Cichorium intybus TaxID=13427 RepID=A0ACB9AIV3_CICIN|nr:hypothetical protein L2E82_39318 [Cichorium intybus]
MSLLKVLRLQLSDSGLAISDNRELYSNNITGEIPDDRGTLAKSMIFQLFCTFSMCDHQAMDRAHRLGQRKVVNVHCSTPLIEPNTTSPLNTQALSF